MAFEDEILNFLNKKKNVLLMGAPGTGKSRMLNRIASYFEGDGNDNTPRHNQGAKVPIPSSNRTAEVDFLKGKKCKVFRTVMHQNTKYRDFFTGFVPSTNGTNEYKIHEGILYKANEFAKQDNCASLLIIDELNRGPVVEVFGGSIVAMECDKRLSENNAKDKETQYFDLLNPQNGEFEEYAFSPNLYILAAMNQADVSVAPLDVAFLRRWVPIKLIPDYSVLEEKFGFSLDAPIPQSFETPNEIYYIATKALEEINRLIIIGKGADYQLGHGILLTEKDFNKTKEQALKHIVDIWKNIFTHIEELFFGDVNVISFIVNANKDKSPYKVKEEYFAGESKLILECEPITTSNILDVYTSVISHD